MDSVVGPPGDIRWAPDGSRTAVLSGELDVDVVDRVDALGRTFTGVERVDASAVTFIDSTGLNFLIRIAREAAAAGRPPVVLMRPAPRVREMLALTGTAALFTFEG